MRVPTWPLLLTVIASLSAPARALELSTDHWFWWTAGLWNLNGTSGRADHVVYYDGETYFGGAFQRAGLESISNLARWDGSAWTPTTLGPPFAIYAGDLIARHQRFDGNGITQMVAPSQFHPTTMYGDATHLAVGGYSAAASGVVVSVWNETQQRYENIPGTFTNPYSVADPTILALLPWQGGWIAAGIDFYEVGGVPAQFAAYWDGAQWNDWSRPGYCYSLAEYGGKVHIGDRFGIFRRDGSSWTQVAGITSSGIVPSVRVLRVDGGFLYAGGQFVTIGPLNTRNIARFDGSLWRAMDTGIDGAHVASIATAGSFVYAGGSFSGASGVNVRNAAYWDGTRWNRMGPAGLELVDTDGGAVAARTWALHDGEVYAGGEFAAWGVQPLNGIGKLADRRWESLSNGFDGPVNDLVTYGGLLVAVGEFTQAGATVTPGIARRASGNWFPMTSSMNGILNDALVLDGDLYVGGNFYEINGESMSHVARYDGAAWSRVGGHVFPSVMALGSTQGDLVIGGSFVLVEGQPMLYVARWDSGQWNPMGAGLPTPVMTLAEIDGVLYAGGNFGVRAWTGSAWTQLGGGVNGAVLDITSWGGRVVMAGDFTQVEGQPQAGVASWDPLTQSWTDPGFELRQGSSSPGTGRALLAVGSTLHLSGTFGHVDAADGSSVDAANVAQITDMAIVAAPPAASASRTWLIASPNPFNPRTTIDFGIVSAGLATMEVFDLRGRRVSTLLHRNTAAGSHRIEWNGCDASGRPVASGVYVLRLQTRSAVSTRKIVVAN